MPLGTEVGRNPGHIVLDGDPALPTERNTVAPPTFRPMSNVAKRSPMSATACVICHASAGTRYSSIRVKI